MQVTIYSALVLWFVLWALRVQMDLQTLRKVGIQFILSIPASSNKGFKGRGFGELKAVISYLRTESMLCEGPRGRNKKKYERGIVSNLKSWAFPR